MAKCYLYALAPAFEGQQVQQPIEEVAAAAVAAADVAAVEVAAEQVSTAEVAQRRQKETHCIVGSSLHAAPYMWVIVGCGLNSDGLLQRNLKKQDVLTYSNMGRVGD